jgi:hypothetical protein
MENVQTTVAEVQTLVGRIEQWRLRIEGALQQMQKEVRAEIMERIDRLQDEITKQRIEATAGFDLLRDSSPAGLLARISHQEEDLRALTDEIRSLRDEIRHIRRE